MNIDLTNAQVVSFSTEQPTYGQGAIRLTVILDVDGFTKSFSLSGEPVKKVQELLLNTIIEDKRRSEERRKELEEEWAKKGVDLNAGTHIDIDTDMTINNSK